MPKGKYDGKALLSPKGHKDTLIQEVVGGDVFVSCNRQLSSLVTTEAEVDSIVEEGYMDTKLVDA